MRIRRFTGADTAAALRRVKDVLGAEAVILGTRAGRGGGVEITAAVDPHPPGAAAPASAAAGDELGAILQELRALGARLARLDGEDGSAAAGALAARLARHGLAPALAGRVAASVAEERRAGAADEAALGRALARHLLPPAPPGRARVTAFVGPTGSGKTTTIAKLAAADAGAARVGLVMADTWRVGAEAQLAAYARLLGVPMRVARDGAELGDALAAFADCERIYVDTAGLGGAAAGTAELARLLAGTGEEVAVAAVMAATASEAALRAAWARLDGLAPRSCVLTKLDEGGGLGAACSWLAEAGVGLAWLGTGQRVPQDLTAASGGALAHWLLAA
jgi:flagellar biosynthesis protein FlhF